MTESRTEPTLTPVDFDPFADGELTTTAPTTAAQAEIWVSSQMGDDASCAYNESVTLFFSGRLDVDAMRGALARVVERHEALRTSISRDGKLLCIAASAPPVLEVVDLSSLGADERTARFAALLRATADKPFDLEHGPLFLAQLVRFGAEEHRLVLTAHHIVCDGWSFAVVFQDLGVLYSAAVQRRAPELKEAHDFSAYARAERAAEGTSDDVEAWWLERFAGELPVLDLPADRPRPPLRSYDADRVDHTLEAELVRALKKVGGRAGASFFVTLLAGFSAFLHRLTGDRDLVIGIPAAGQAAVGKEMLVGHCANLLPLRISVDPAQTFVEHLKGVRKVVLDAYDHQRYTFGRMLSGLSIPRDPSRMPLVSVLFNLDVGVEGGGLRFEGLEASYQANPRTKENFELFVNAVESTGGSSPGAGSPGSLVLETQFSTSLFDAVSVRSRLEGYEALLRTVAAGREGKIGELPVLSDAERKALLVDHNATQVALPTGATVHGLFAEQARRAPDKLAVRAGAESVTYAELAKRAHRIARRLQKSGVGPGSLVGLCVERGVDMVAAMLGILETGAAYVPMDQDYPRARLAHMLQDSGARVVVTEAAVEDAVPLPGARSPAEPRGYAELIHVDGDEVRGADATPLDVRVDAESRAYVIYTSGSTGLPKGVAVPHRAVVNFLQSMRRRPGLVEADVLYAVTTLSFDIAGLEIFLPLTTGATLVVGSREVASDGYQLAAALEEAQATVMQATPATWRLLVAAGWDGGGTRSPKLKVLCGGEALPPELARALVERAASVWNMYGPTETTIWSTCHPLTAADPRPLIGRPIDNTTVYVLDAAMQPVPPGAPGELYIGGSGVALGYLNRPELSAERFVPDPFGAQGAVGTGKLYRTGDVVRWLPSGELEFFRRNDAQVKVRGYRIELGEIEAVMAEHPAVAEAAAVLAEERPGDVRVVGYVVLRPGEEATVTELRKHLRKKLPDYMIPNAVVDLPEMPRTPNGKVDRNALKARSLEGGGRRPVAETVSPRTDSEKLLAELWQSLLKVERVGALDNFYELGGDSLLSMDVVVKLQEKAGVRIGPRVLLLESLENVARTLDDKRREQPVDAARAGAGAASRVARG
ncbi:MAG: amino acid adenylation domain-containing protein [Polyangiaceae bacterium]